MALSIKRTSDVKHPNTGSRDTRRQCMLMVLPPAPSLTVTESSQINGKWRGTERPAAGSVLYRSVDSVPKGVKRLKVILGGVEDCPSSDRNKSSSSYQVDYSLINQNNT